MNSGYSNEKKSGRNKVKYSIFNLMLLSFFFAFVMIGGVVKAAESIVVHQSNHKGNNGDASILGVTGLGKNAYYNGNNVAFVQTTGVAAKNTVSFTVTIELDKTVSNEYTISGTSVLKNGNVVASYDTATGKFTIGNVEYTKKSDGIYVGESKIASLSGDTFTLSIANTINGVVVFESGYTVSGGQDTVANYDSYKKDSYGRWNNMTGGVGTIDGQTAFAKGVVLANNSDFATTAANSTQLEANSTGAGNYSLFYISEVVVDSKLVVTLNYVYTIRSSGWGTKTINVTLYNDAAYDSQGNLLDPTAAHYRTIDFIASKPISEYNDGTGETIKAADATACGDFEGPNRIVQTSPSVVYSNKYDDICITYVNSNTISNDKDGKPMTVSLPKEVAYDHKITTGLEEGENPTVDQIKAQSIYAINTFSNAGATGGKVVKYYYWNFKDASNTSMLPSEGYTMTLMVDATGVYVLEIRDVFGNEFVSSGVTVSDIEITNIIVDHTGAAGVNVMKATGEYAESDGWKQAWSFGIDEPYEIVFSKIQQGEVTVTFHVFQKKVIKLGVFEGVSSGVEDIAKQPHSHTDVGSATLPYTSRFSTAGVSIWRVANPTVDAGYETALSSAIADANDKVSCGTTNEIAYDCTFSVGDYGDSISYNKITFKVKNNGRYRVMITDSASNTTDTTEYNDEGNDIDYTNPEVEVSVVDRTTPVITSSLSGATTSAASTSVNSHDYVIGGGNDQSMNPTISGAYKDDVDELPENYYTTGDYSAIYYNYNGLKAFTYEDALKIAKIQVVDDVYYYTSSSKNNKFSGYEVSFSKGGTSGAYADPASGYKSARTGAGTTNYDLHSYVITNNVTSFSYGLVKEVGYTNVAGASINSYSKIDGSTTDLKYVNGSGANFYSAEMFIGYLGIEFKIKLSDGTYKTVCELSIDANDASSASNDNNKTCFEKMNKIIDDVEDFRMIFSATDAVGNVADKTYTVDVAVIDTTNPGIDPAKKHINYTNTFDGSKCRLEIGVNIQNEKTLLECYGISVLNENTFFVMDNNVYSDNDYNSGTGGSYVYNFNDSGIQYYVSGTSNYDYLTKIKTSIKEGTESFTEIKDSNTKVLNKSGDHFVKIEISDHWDPKNGNSENNTLVFIINYYVNPKTLLIEPLANEKMYGEKDPTFDYCVYINSDNSTFYYDNYFFDKDFINRYFNYIYCTKDVYVEMKPTDVYAAPSNQAATAGYSYYQFAGSYDSGVTAVNTAAIDGKYLKVNNTFVYINGGNTGLNAGNRYSMSYTSKNDGSGEYIKYTPAAGGSETYEKILSGYKYTDGTCTVAYMGSDLTGYFYRTTSNECIEVTSSNTYDRAYTPSSTGNFLKYNNSNAATSVLVSGDSFTGKLARVESSCYNNVYGTIEKDSTQDGVVLDDLYTTNKSKFDALVGCAEETHTNNDYKGNDNVGQYNIVLGTLAISRTGDAANYNKDYVIKINTNYWSAGTVTDTTGTGTKTQSTATTTDYGTAKTRDVLVDNKLVDDVIKEESTVKFTIRQAVLTATANGGSKLFGEQDSYSNNWNDTTTATNNSAQGYLGGYTISGYRYDDADADNVVLGTLRRQIGEQVGIYRICNLSGNPSDTDELGSGCDSDPKVVNQYDETQFWNFAGYAGLYAMGGATGSAAGTADTAALTIDINTNINAALYGSATGRKLNGANRNYAIIYVGNDYYIQAGQITIQPGINQGKEYSNNEYSDPLWQLVVYGETITQQNDGSWNTNIAPSTTTGQFNGYTESYAVETYQTYSQGQIGTQYENDSEIYFARRKTTSLEYDYTYVVPVTVTKKYAKTDGIYHESTSGTYIYAYGQYHNVGSAAINSTVNITVVGRLVNQTYTMFNTGNFVLERESGSAVEWYKYVDISNIKYNADNTTIKYYTLKQNSNTKCVITSNAVTAKVAAGSGETLVYCTNYNVNYTNIAPVAYTSVEGNTEATEVAQIVNLRTTYTTGTRPEYKPDGIHSCTLGGDESDKTYSYPCKTDDITQITFEIFKREIHLEFIDYNYTFVYGNRYNWYYTNIMEITNANQASKEGDVFVCYSDLGDYVVDCTNDADYGLTAGDEWDDIGLEFHMHSTVSATGSAYYDNDDYAVPAGKYYVYASITETQNYKFVYRGGTLTISPKVTNVELTGYTMEYGESYYTSYGTGTDYTNYTLQGDTKRVDSNFTTSSEALITITGITTGNEHGNSYGFVVEGLDDKDTIAENFKGRPTRTTGENVGVYAIGVNTIATIKNTRVVAATTGDVFKECATVDENETCTFVTRSADDKTDGRDNSQNYHITYSLNNNEGAYLYITPATLTIEVLTGQTKMYGCAYYQVITDHEKYYEGYTYESGYTSTNCNTTANTNLDFAYKYTVTGDKKVNGGSAYTVTTNTSDGTVVTDPSGLTSSLDNTTRLFRILKDVTNYDYSYDTDILAKLYVTAGTKGSGYEYQGQSVGVYAITLGDLDVSTNGNAKCDAYNNPAANGTYNCKNYNINYYGNSTSKDDDVDTHKYTETTKVAKDDLALYTLNYVANTSGSYVLINGKFIDVEQIKVTGTTVTVNDYMDISTRRYNKRPQYEEDASGEYIKLNGSYVTIASLSGSRYPSSTGGTQSSTGDYLKVGDKYIKLSTITKYKQNYVDGAAESTHYVSNANGAYVWINDVSGSNGSYVELDDLVRYKLDNGKYVEDANGTYVMSYKTVDVSSLTRYSLDITNVTNKTFSSGASAGKNVYAFVNGSYVPLSSLTFDGDNKVAVNSANTTTGAAGAIVTTRGDVTTDIDFTIIARKVFVHTEFNIKAYSEAEPVEYITCAEITAAYSRDCTHYTTYAENYKTDGAAGARLELGVSMYYALENSLAKSPWTAWKDSTTASYRGYDDIQYDVLRGLLKRDSGQVLDIAGKYTFDFEDVTNVGTVNGRNYMIVHVTEMDNGASNGKGTHDGNGMDNTYLKGGKKLSELMYETCSWGQDYCASDSSGNPIRIKMKESNTKLDFTLKVDNNGDYSESGSTSKSISLVTKYDSSNNKLVYWHLGFYKEDTGSDRVGELAKWWNNRSPFSTPYDTFKTTNNSGEGQDGSKIQDPYFENDRPVYFEIVKRTIFLYAVDVEKVYGEQDKYRDFLVAICPNDQGYTIDGSGNVKCKSEEVEGSTFTSAYGLGSGDYAKFIGDDKIMNQDVIRGITSSDNYVLSGKPHRTDAFGIYFRRTPGEDAGVYSVTACAAQSDVTDCTDPNLQEEVNTPVNYIGDNYKIIEIPGVLTIKTREIKVTPNSGQGFAYGNYTEDGDMPNIVFTESHEHGSDATGDGLVGEGVVLINGSTSIDVTNNVFTIDSVEYKFDGEFVIKTATKEKVATISVTETSGVNSKTVSIGGTTYSIVQKSRCLVNISGLSIICLNDAQNEALASSNAFIGKKASEGDTKYFDFAQAGLLSNLGYSGSTGVPSLYSGEDTFNPSDILLEYSSYNVYADVYSNPKNFNSRRESQSNSALDLKYSSTTGYRFSRDVGTYTIVQGSLGVSDNVKKTKEIWIRVTKARLYSDAAGATQSDSGTYLKYGDKLIDISSKTKYEYQCSGTEGNVTCTYVTKADGNFVKLETTDAAMTFYNYSIKTFVEDVTYTITPADIKVTPGEKQYKIYGEADVEIEFTVETTYTVANTHYSSNKTNIKQICNGATCYTDLSGYDDGSGNILLTAGWTVTLNNYAYKEYTNNAGTTEAAGNLDYGKNTAATKHAGTESALDQATTGADHYDKYTDYNASINTSRILIGNLYVNSFDQTVGEKAINGDKIIVAKNILGNVNYTYVSTQAKHYQSDVLFVIIPRPVNVEITNVTKTYGQATDKTSCESYDTECIVGQGILDDAYDTTNESKLANNFRIVTDRQTKISAGEVTINTANVTGIKVIYYRSDDANKLARMNMPTAKTTAGNVYNDYATISAANANKYYTATGDAETKNASLDIEVNRENENIARNAECLVSESLVSRTAKGCEDVGEYNLKFVSKLGKTNSIAETLVTEGSITDGRGTNEAYGNAYWGYNPNYYVIVYKNFEASGWTADNGSTSYASVSVDKTLLTMADNANPEESATLKIRKRPVEITVETISAYEYAQSNTGNFLKIVNTAETHDNADYRQITRTNVYTKLASGKYSQVTLSDLSSIPDDTYYLCTYVTDNKNVDGNCYKITNAKRYTRSAKTVGEKYNIQQTMHVFPLPSATADPNDGVQYLSNSESTIHTTYKYLTWNEHNRQVRTGDVLVGEVAYCNKATTLDPDLDSIRSSTCASVSGELRYYTSNINTAGHADWFDTKDSGHYVIVREASRLYIGSSSSMNGTLGSAYEGNNYNTTFINGILQIDDDKTAPIINVGTEFVQKEANDGKMIGTEEGTVLKFLDNLKTNGCVAVKDSASTYSECSGINFTFENDTDKTNAHLTYTETVNREYLATILDWFDISSLDPSVMRDEVPVQNNYFPRWYVAIQNDFDQRKVGDYTIFVYAQDLSGNVSLATTVTLRVVDTTDPEVGTLNLYDAKVKCKEGFDCRKEENWAVAESIYLPILNLDDSALPTAVKANKYLRTNNSYSLNNAYGTYYLIPVGTPASAVKHRGWTNARDGIYLTVTGGDDNSLAYLDTSKYSVKYTIDGTKITKGSGQNILYGSFIDLSHVVKYRKASIDSNGLEIFTTGGTNVYIPDAEGTIIKYKGYYYDLSTGKYMNASGSDITAPTDAEYTVKLYTLSGNDYTPATDGKASRTGISGRPNETEYVGYYLLDGSFYQIPNDETYYKFDATNGYIRGTGEGFTYINIAQWDHYYSRDGGNSFIKYDRDATGEDDTSRYLALGQDGQRLIMIKAVDNGYNYATQDVTKTFYDKAYCDSMEQQSGRPNYFCDKWNKVNLGKGYNVAHSGSTITRTASSDGKYTEANGAKQMLYNVSQWHTYTDGQDAQDVKYAYLDTIGPNMWLNNQFIEVYEYGCTNCVKNYEETFGKVSDGYLFKLSSMTTYNSSGVATANGTHVKFNGVLIEISSARRFNLNNDNSITQNSAGEYIYLGGTDAAVNIDTLITSKIVGDASVSAYKVYDKTKDEADRNVSKTLPGTPTTTATEEATKLDQNTNKLNSGIGKGDDLFAGTAYGEGIEFGGGTTIGDNYVRIQIYANVANGLGAVGNAHGFIDDKTNYKFQIEGAVGTYTIKRCKNIIGVNEWCTGETTVGTTYASMKLAIEDILAAYKSSFVDGGGNYVFNKNDITFTIDYSVYDLAGNESLYVRKGVLLTSFTRTVMVHNGGAAATALNIDLPQNADPTLALSQFEVVTANGSNLRSDEKITQTIYYNGQIVAENQEYDVKALANLDTSVPGTYKVVYTISRREGAGYVQGNSVELVVNINPDVASTSSANVDYKQVITTAFIASSVILVFAYIYIANKKRKSN